MRKLVVGFGGIGCKHVGIRVIQRFGGFQCCKLARVGCKCIGVGIVHRFGIISRFRCYFGE
ncbi:MAG: hypothetical protein J5818_02505 [Eggerthellaceae bacterium]|nr:hypothetical protein [Eggerthellaceae bacterium]